MGSLHKGDVVVVTGAAGGFGAAYAAAFLAEGASVALVDVSEEGLATLEGNLDNSRGSFRSYVADLTDFAVVEDMFRKIDKDLGPTKILVNNAGVGKILRIFDTTEADYDWMVDNNLKQTFVCSKEAARRMIDHKLNGRIINMASLAGLRVITHLAAYSVAKAGIIHLTHCMAKEWGAEGINTNCICPGFFDTKMNHPLWQTDQGKMVLANLPRGRLGLPEDLVKLVMFLSSPEAHYINGAVIPVDDAIQHVFPF